MERGDSPTGSDDSEARSWPKERRARALSALRKARGLSQGEISRRTAIPQPTLSAHENGSQSPSSEYLEKILDAMGLSHERLLDAERFVEYIETLAGPEGGSAQPSFGGGPISPSTILDPPAAYGEPEDDRRESSARDLVAALRALVDERLDERFPRPWRPEDS